MRTYEKDFKINAVNLYRKSGRSLKKIAEELGLAASTLNHWVQDIRQKAPKVFLEKAM